MHCKTQYFHKKKSEWLKYGWEEKGEEWGNRWDKSGGGPHFSFVKGICLEVYMGIDLDYLEWVRKFGFIVINVLVKNLVGEESKCPHVGIGILCANSQKKPLPLPAWIHNLVLLPLCTLSSDFFYDYHILLG